MILLVCSVYVGWWEREGPLGKISLRWGSLNVIQTAGVRLQHRGAPNHLVQRDHEEHQVYLEPGEEPGPASICPSLRQGLPSRWVHPGGSSPPEQRVTKRAMVPSRGSSPSISALGYPRACLLQLTELEAPGVWDADAGTVEITSPGSQPHLPQSQRRQAR